MRWSIIRLIWARELRDQLRDRRTVFMIAVLPLLLYPALGFGVLQLAYGYIGRQNVVGVLGAEYLPPYPQSDKVPDYPPLFVRDGERIRIPAESLDKDQEPLTLSVRLLEGSTPATSEPNFVDHIDRSPLDDRQVDVLLVVPSDFAARLRENDRVPLYLLSRAGDEHSRLVDGRLTNVLHQWRRGLKNARLQARGLPPEFDEPIEIRDPERDKSSGKRAAEDLLDTLLKIFPFVLVMWSLAGALYPAVDLCAGEKERGTMETLLISPASREEIVWGKFLTIWVFSAATALLNLLSMGITSWQFSRIAPLGAFQPGVLAWGVLLLLPLSAFFSAVSLAVGAYARSSKEGQYYLMPLFLVTMPLIFLTLAPGVELNAFYSMVPVTGVALLLQRLMAAGLPGPGLWAYFLPVLAPMVLYSWLALRWAIGQFQREEVLFREAERLELGLWLRRLWRDKEALPSSGEALCCFGVILGLQFLSFGLGGAEALLHGDLGRFLRLDTVRYLGCVGAPPLIMALLLTTRPRQGLALAWPKWWSWPAAALLAVLLLPPLVGLTLAITELNPDLKQSILESSGAGAAVQEEVRLRLASADRWTLLLVMGLLPALCEELAFRGFILGGLRRRFRPWTAVFLSSFLFAVYQMNVFQFAPHFVVGTVLALITTRSGSLGPAVVFHFTWNMLLLTPVLFPTALADLPYLPADGGFRPAVVAVMLMCLVLAAVLLSALGRVRQPQAAGREEDFQLPASSAGKELTRQAR
jgi:sodium transport system permease protein